jgi:hypothetical protein
MNPLVGRNKGKMEDYFILISKGKLGNLNIHTNFFLEFIRTK